MSDETFTIRPRTLAEIEFVQKPARRYLASLRAQAPSKQLLRGIEQAELDLDEKWLDMVHRLPSDEECMVMVEHAERFFDVAWRVRSRQVRRQMDAERARTTREFWALFRRRRVAVVAAACSLAVMFAAVWR